MSATSSASLSWAWTEAQREPPTLGAPTTRQRIPASALFEDAAAPRSVKTLKLLLVV